MNTSQIQEGFLHAHGTKILDGSGKELLLSGWGLGNWMLLEGYMWNSAGSVRLDRSRRIIQVIKELTGSDYAKSFFHRYYRSYITRSDIKAMADLGYNSVRIPMHWNLFMKEELGVSFVEEGFELLDECIKWCKEYGIYVFLDLHAAPGGQTGANIDDSIDDIPRLFMDEEAYEKGVAFWAEIARRYKDETIIGGYDLLNEPIRPDNGGTLKNYDYLLPKLIAFYDDCIAEIRKVDPNHMISIEGHHWSTDTSVFFKKYDDNSVFHFHRYACPPTKESFNEFLEISQRLEVPLWLGETGENHLQWFSAMYPLAHELGIGYNLWPWKKMNCVNSPCCVEQPKDWDLIIHYTKGGVHPGTNKAKEILEEYLENMKYENCTKNELVTKAVFRNNGTSLCAVDFDEFPGDGISYYSTAQKGFSYRKETKMTIMECKDLEKRFVFDIRHDRYGLFLSENEFACYTFKPQNAGIIHIFGECLANSEIVVEAANTRYEVPVKKGPLQQEIDFPVTEKLVVRIMVKYGRIQLDKIDLS